jgi:hypothetical protein
MNLDDLRRELRTRAAEPGPTSMPDRLAGVQTKVRAARRRKAAASGVAVLASVSVLGLAFAQVWDGDRAEVAETEFVPLPDRLHGDLLIHEQYNDPGESELSWDVTLNDDLRVVPHMTCQLPGDAVLPQGDGPVLLQWGVGGTSTFGSQCGADAVSVLQPEGPVTRAEWRRLGVRPDKPFEIEMWLEQGADRIEVDGARFGIGLYDKIGDREHRSGVELPVIVDLGDDSYRLDRDRFETLPLSEDQRRLELRIPASDTPIAVAYGWQTDTQAASCELFRDGEPFRSCYGGPIEGPEVIDSDEAQTLTIKADGSSVEGALVLAVYELDD